MSTPTTTHTPSPVAVELTEFDVQRLREYLERVTDHDVHAPWEMAGYVRGLLVARRTGR